MKCHILVGLLFDGNHKQNRLCNEYRIKALYNEVYNNYTVFPFVSDSLGYVINMSIYFVYGGGK